MEHVSSHEHLAPAVHATGESAALLLDDRWDRLVDAQPCPNPTLTSTWLRHMFEWAKGTPLVVTVERAGELVAGGAFEVHRPAGRIGPRVARWLGDHRQWFSSDLLVAPDDPAAGATVVRHVLGIVDGCLLPVRSGGAMERALEAVAPWRVSLDEGAESWVVALPPPGLERARKKVAYSLRRAEREGIAVTVRTSTAPETVLDALERLFGLHRQRWDRDPTEEARFSTTELHRAWYRRVTADMASRGLARTVEVFEDDVLVASSLGFLTGRGGLAHTTAHRRDARVLGPGHIRLLALVDEMARSGAVVLDLGLGAGDPGGPKARFGPTLVRERRVLAGATTRDHRRLKTLVALRTRSKALQRREGRWLR